MDIELITLVNSFRNTIALNNLLIKEKILRKLDMIHTMRWYGFQLMNFPKSKSNNIIQELRRIDKEGDIIRYSRATNNSDTNKLLGDILHNAYQASGYDMILSNAPLYGNTICGDLIQLDCEVIYDTLVQYAPPDAVKSVLQIMGDTYLIKMDSNVNALALCNLLNEKLLEGRIIKVEYIEPLQINNQIEFARNKADSDDIDDIDYDTVSNSNANVNMNANLNVNIGGDKSIRPTYFAWFLYMFNEFLKRMRYLKNIRWI
jgi:hypothetical protein